jgi:hypothetical protein
MSKTVVTSLTIDGVAVTERFQSSEVRMADSNHVLAIVDVVMTPTTRIFDERLPVFMQWGQMPNEVETFYGYVDHHQALTPREGDVLTDSVIRYVFIGTSMPMNHEKTRAWRSVSGSSIARQIANEHGLRSVVHTTGRVYAYLTQNGISDWTLLKQLAADSGFRLWVNGATLWFVDPEILLSGPRSRDMPTFSKSNRAASQDNLLALEVINGTGVSDGGRLAKRTVYGFDPRSKRFFQSTTAQDGAYLEVTDQHSPIESLSEATTVLSAANAASRNWLVANAQVVGTPRMRPESLVNIDGDSVPADYRGIWIVREARHVLRAANKGYQATNNYQTHLTLTRDRQQTLSIRDTQTIAPQTDSVPCRLENGVWKASILGGINVG